MEELTQIQIEVVVRALLAERGVELPKDKTGPKIITTVDENTIEKEYSGKTTVKEFAEAIHEAERLQEEANRNRAIDKIQKLQDEFDAKAKERTALNELRPSPRPKPKRPKRETKFSKKE